MSSKDNFTDCPICGSINSLERVVDTHVAIIRGDEFPVERVRHRCKECGEFFVHAQDPDWRRTANDLYREANGLLHPVDIKSWRERLDLKQSEVTSLLGWGEVTLGRYENGALPTEANEKRLREVMMPDGLLAAMAAQPGAIEESKAAKIKAILSKEAAALSSRKAAEACYADLSIEQTGNRHLDFGRLSEVLRLLCAEAVYKTKLNKLLFYVDFKSFSLFGHSITGLSYCKLQHGPVPHRYTTIYNALELSGILDIEASETYYGAITEKMKFSGKATPGVLSDDEEKLILNVLRATKGLTARQVSNISHMETAWIKTETTKLISFSFASDLRFNI